MGLFEQKLTKYIMMQNFRQWFEELETPTEDEPSLDAIQEPNPLEPVKPAFQPVVSPRILLYQTVKGLLENIDIKQLGSKSKSNQTINNFQKEITKFNNLDNDLVDDKHEAAAIMKRIVNYTTGSSKQITEIVSLQMVLVASIIDGTLRSILKQFLKSIAQFIPFKSTQNEADENWSTDDLDEYYTFLHRLIGEAMNIDSEISDLRTYAPDMLNDFMQNISELSGSPESFWTHIHDYDRSTDKSGMQKGMLKLALYRMYNNLGSIEEDETNTFMKFQVLMVALTARPVMVARLNETLHRMYRQVTNKLNAIAPLENL